MEQKNKTHVLYVLTKLELGGAQKICLSLLKDVPGEHFSSGLISGSEGVLVDEAKRHDFVHLLNTFKREVGIKTIFFEFATFFKMISLMRKAKKNFGTVIVHTHSTKAGLMGRWAAFFAGIKKRVHTVHGFGFHEKQSKIGWFINFLLEYITSFVTTHYICVSHVDRKTGIKHIPRFAKKSSVIRAAVDWDSFTKNHLPEKKPTFYPAKEVKSPSKKEFVFGTISCLKPQKNIIDLLRAFKFVHDNTTKKNVRLQIIGDGIERPMVEAWIKKNNLVEQIDLLSWQNDIPTWMQSWDVFTMSSLWEGLPCAIVEARLSKLPVVSYKIAGIPEVIEDGKNGFLVEPGDFSLLGQKMLSLYENETLRKEISSFSENLDDFKDSVMVKKHTKLYAKI